MKDRAKVIFGNVISDGDYRKAEKSKAKFARRFQDDAALPHPARVVQNPHIGPALGVQDIRIEPGEGLPFDTEKGVIVGGMLPKVKCCEDAIEKGVKNVIIMDGRVPHSILMELLTDEGAGTMVTGE